MMEKKKRTKSKVYIIAMIWGIIFTAFFSLALVPKLIMSIVDDFSKFTSDLGNSFTEWLDPTAYFIFYIVGYILLFLHP